MPLQDLQGHGNRMNHGFPMPNYDNCPVVACKRTTLSAGSVNIIIARRLPHSLFSIAVFLVDLFKLGLKDSFGSERVNGAEFNESYEGIADGFASAGIELS